MVVSSSAITTDDIPNFSWSKVVSGKPTTLSGYGITDAFSKAGGTILGPIHATNPLSLDYSSSLSAIPKQKADASLEGMIQLYAPYKTGNIRRVANKVTLDGYLRCNGASVSKTTYAGLYTVIGDSYNNNNNQPGSGQPWLQQYGINTTQSEGLGVWTTGTAFPVTFSVGQTFVTKNRVYAVGGNQAGSRSAAVYTAPISEAGVVGAWTTSTALPATVSEAGLVVTKNRVFLLGGYVSSVLSNVIYSAAINADGTLGTWSNVGTLPVTVTLATCFSTKNRVYLVGVYNGTTGVKTTYTAPINANGTLGSWTTGPTMVNLLPHCSTAVTKDRVYVLGHASGSFIETAPINTDGTLGSWVSAGTTPLSFSYSKIFVSKNSLYVIGRAGGSEIYKCSINTDGTLGTWTTSGNLPASVYYSSMFATSTKLYVIGGYNGTTNVNTVYMTTISGGKDDYSQYYDGTVLATDSDKFALPDMTKFESRKLFSYIKT